MNTSKNIPSQVDESVFTLNEERNNDDSNLIYGNDSSYVEEESKVKDNDEDKALLRLMFGDE